MLGFKIKVNNEQEFIVASDWVAHLLLCIGGYGSDSLHVGGSNCYMQKIVWCYERFQLGDKIRLEVVETDSPSPVKELYPSRMDKNRMMEVYLQYKAEVEKKNLL